MKGKKSPGPTDQLYRGCILHVSRVRPLTLVSVKKQPDATIPIPTGAGDDHTAMLGGGMWRLPY